MDDEASGLVNASGGTRAEVGEGPHWDRERRLLWWVDLLAGLVHRSDLGSGETTTLCAGRPVGAVVTRGPGGLVTADSRGFSFLTVDGVVLDRVEVLALGHRMNDAKTDPAGRLWAGSTAMDFAAGQGSLHVLNPDGGVETVLSGLSLPNGLGWSPKGDIFYLVDSVQGWLRAWDFVPETGQISSPRTIAEFSCEGEVPDGLCVDATGVIWVAIWGGSRLERYGPEGQPLGPLPLPVTQPSSCTFAGLTLEKLVVTSARRGLADRATPLDGALLVVTSPGAVGLPVTNFAG
jgi:sugar lactone lactonase YvrE